MTLRGSEQSLLHDLVNVENKDSGRSKSAPLFSRVLIFTIACLTLTVFTVIEALNPADVHYTDKNSSLNSNPDRQVRNLLHLAEFSKTGQDTEAYGPIANRSEFEGTIFAGDVIISPFKSPIDLHLKQLVDSTTQDFTAGIEIPVNRVMHLLARANAENISIAPDLKFFATSRQDTIRACPDMRRGLEMQAFATAPTSTGCFFIEVDPSIEAELTAPRVL